MVDDCHCERNLQYVDGLTWPQADGRIYYIDVYIIDLIVNVIE